MRPSSASLSFLTILLSFLQFQVFAIPSSVSPLLNHHFQSNPPSTRCRSVFPQLTWLRDTLIQTVFRLPKSNSRFDSPTTSSRLPSPHLPSTLLAKYGGDVVLRFNLSTTEDEAALSEAADTLFLDIWEFNNNWADIRLREDDVPSLLGLLPKSLHRAYSNLMPDLAQSIYQSYPSITFADSAFAVDHAFTPALNRPSHQETDNVFFKEYQPLSVIVPWMRLMTSMFTTHVRMIKIGVSYEGRDIYALRVGVHPTNSQDQNPPPRKTIIVNAGIHAREWISVSTVTYLAWSMITSYGKNPEITKLLHEFDWVFIPTINVDGYVYTWESDRLWRKNRQQTNLRFCRGLDLDRGFGFEWDGTSFQSNPCSESFPGDEPFQALESHRLAEWARNETENNNVEFVGFLDLHSYSQQILYPYSYSCSAEPPTVENLEELGIGIAKAIRITSGENYIVSSACEGAVRSTKSKPPKTARMETGGGTAMDWFYHELRVRYSYQIKLRDTGSYGFLLPADQIIPTGVETFNAIKYFGDFLLGNKGIERQVLGSVSVSGDDFIEDMLEEEQLSMELGRDKEDFIEKEMEWEEVMWDEDAIEMELEKEREKEKETEHANEKGEDIWASEALENYELR